MSLVISCIGENKLMLKTDYKSGSREYQCFG